MPKAKKKSKLDPNKLFTVITVSREMIADMLNSAAEVTGVELSEEFTSDDPRLTDKVCQEMADGLYDAFCNGADNEMNQAEQQFYIDALERFEE